MTRRTLLSTALLPVTVGHLQWIGTDLAGDIVSSAWPVQSPCWMGSLLKPFLSLAYLADHPAPPLIECRGVQSHCWLPKGHGQQDLVSALANSCNTYFLHLAAAVNPAALERVCLAFSLAAPSRSWPPSRLIGLGDGWPQTPSCVAAAFAFLARHRTDAGVQMVLSGMRQCAISGTAKEIGAPCYAKTGTGACHHFPSGEGDGYVAVLYPAESPRRVLLAQKHNTTGARTAALVSGLLRMIG